jgi:polyhydroxyalkanoate synthesis regulator phasin
VYKVEKEPVTSEEENEEESSENGRGKMNEWFAENLRMIVSVVIVVVIAGGIYSYSKRAQAPDMKSAATSTEENSEGKISVIGGDSQTTGENEQVAPEAATEQQTQPSENVQAVQPQTSQETGTSFVETAAKGDGSTILARRAIANYLEKNPDSSLTAEHKIYMEDLLRRQVKDGGMKIGDKREFSKDMIAKAIEKSKSLNEKQLKNLQKYSQRVSALK